MFVNTNKIFLLAGAWQQEKIEAKSQGPTRGTRMVPPHVPHFLELRDVASEAQHLNFVKKNEICWDVEACDENLQRIGKFFQFW